jgi:uncharacterized protein
MEKQEVPHEITEFIESRHCMSISVCTPEGPWSATVFYVYDRESMRLIFVSDEQTRHGIAIQKNPKISGTISNDEFNILKIQGIQFEGDAKLTDSIYTHKAKVLFLKKFPFAIVRKLTLWFVEPKHVKMTDNTLFFSAKIQWKRDL